MKSNYGEIINKLELLDIDGSKDSIDDLLNDGIENLLTLHESYKGGLWGYSRDLIGSIFPENFTILKNEFRTARVNEIVGVIYLINKALFLNKNGTKKKFSSLSHLVTLTGFKPVTS
jgi:site-specific DNA recombinase